VVHRRDAAPKVPLPVLLRSDQRQAGHRVSPLPVAYLRGRKEIPDQGVGIPVYLIYPIYPTDSPSSRLRLGPPGTVG
jgi:hypothetical protein